MIDDDHDNSTNSVTMESKTTSMSSDEQVSKTEERQPVDSEIIDQNQNSTENESQNQIAVVNNDDDDDTFIRITAAHQILTEAQTYDKAENYSSALYLYRICVDLLLEELMFAESTDQSRIYLRERCAALLDRVDHLKTMLEPIPVLSTTEQPTEIS